MLRNERTDGVGALLFLVGPVMGPTYYTNFLTPKRLCRERSHHNGGRQYGLLYNDRLAMLSWFLFV